MRRIVLLFLIIFSFVQGVFLRSFALDDSDENIEQYFDQEPEVVQTIDGQVEYNELSQEDEQRQTELEEDAIRLDDDVLYKHVNFTTPKKISSDNLKLDHKKPTFQPFGQEMTAASKFSTQEYAISPVSTSYAEKFGSFSFGTKYSSSVDSARISYATAVFSRYEGRHLAFTTTFLKSTGNSYASYSDRFQVAPEWKITKRLSLLDVMQTDMLQISKKNELVLRYRPKFDKYADDIEFEVGAGQSFYNDAFVKSSVRFSTSFKL